MKYVMKIFFFVITLLFFIPNVFADTKDNLVNVYLFYSDTCPHCAAERELFDEIKKDYDNVMVYEFEVTKSDENLDLMLNVAELFDTKVTGVPFTIIADKVHKGFNHESSKSKILGTIDYYSEHGYKDVVGEYMGDVELPGYDIDEDANDETFNEYINNYGNHVVSILGFRIETKNLALPLVSILIGLVDGFNPCAMWVLLFLISMLIGMKNKKRMWTLGVTFLLTSALIYLLFMIAWLNVATFLTSVSWIRISLGLVALGGGCINLYGYFKNRKTEGCTVVNDKKRNRIFDRIRRFTQEKNFFLAIIGVMALAISVNIVELACSAGLPVMFVEILSINNLSIIEEILYIGLYMLFFLIDDLVIFFIAMGTMQLTGFSTKYGKLSKVIGGILLLLIGLLLIFKPEWLMFNF